MRLLLPPTLGADPMLEPQPRIPGAFQPGASRATALHAASAVPPCPMLDGTRHHTAEPQAGNGGACRIFTLVTTLWTLFFSQAYWGSRTFSKNNGIKEEGAHKKNTTLRLRSTLPARSSITPLLLKAGGYRASVKAK